MESIEVLEIHVRLRQVKWVEIAEVIRVDVFCR